MMARADREREAGEAWRSARRAVPVFYGPRVPPRQLSLVPSGLRYWCSMVLESHRFASLVPFSGVSMRTSLLVGSAAFTLAAVAAPRVGAQQPAAPQYPAPEVG